MTRSVSSIIISRRDNDQGDPRPRPIRKRQVISANSREISLAKIESWYRCSFIADISGLKSSQGARHGDEYVRRDYEHRFSFYRD